MLSRLSLIDDLATSELDGTLTVTLTTLGFPVGASLEDGRDHLSIGWKKNGNAQSQLTDKFNWSLPKDQAIGNWEVSVKLISKDIRHDPEGHTEVSHAFSVK